MQNEVRLDYDPALPISSAVGQIMDAFTRNQVIIVAGETGSGKTTQLPKMCLAAGRARIGHTQPRRIAARTVADRIAEELGTELGDVVGYQVRFTRKASAQTAIKVMTDGILLAEIAHDRELRAYDTIIIDEAHERSLNIDFLLGYLKQLLPRRKDLKVIITSATIDTQRFSDHFEGAPIIEVSGRTYPVDMVYQPLGEDDDLFEGIADAVETLHAVGEGDTLVFLSGEREIRDAAEAVKGRRIPGLQVLPLYARLSAAEQHRVFEAHTERRVILATNVAETSLTVPGIRSVIDPGLARISRYSARTKVQRLPIEPISQASANQRAGRCGRLGPGICIRLYSEEDFASRPEFTKPEILRTNLASVLLQMADAKLGSIDKFPFVERPDRSQVADGLRLLRELGAIEEHPKTVRLTHVGRTLARLPVDPRLGRMLVEASQRDVLRDATAVVAALAIPDVRERPAERQAQADACHQRFWQPHEPGDVADDSDFSATLRLWRYLKRQRKELSGNAFRRMCREEYLHYMRIREWQDLTNQLRLACRDLRLSDSGKGSADALHLSMLSGLLSHVGLLNVSAKPERQQRRRPIAEYVGARGARFAIQPGSAAAKTNPELVMAVELVETSRLWARTVAPIKAEWVEEVGSHLLKKSYSEPRWSAAGGQSVVSEKVTLLGVPIIANRTVSFGPIDPVAAREIFIRSALVEGQWRTRHHFFARNERLRREAEDLEERTRRRDLVVDDAAIFAFYDERVPVGITTVAHFDRWWKEKRRRDDRFLDLTMDVVTADHAGDLDAQSFPDVWTCGEHRFDVSYTFDPGHQHDGVSVDVDVSTLNQTSGTAFSWQVPGLRAELATELIRHLPKAQRVNFVPAPDWGRRALDWLASRADLVDTPFPEALAHALTALSGVQVAASSFDQEALPPHLRVTIVVVDGSRPIAQQELGRGKDFEKLRTTFAPVLNRRLNEVATDVIHQGSTAWEFSEIPRTTQVGASLVGYPALVDLGDRVGVKVANTPSKASSWHRRGLRRLVTLVSVDPTRSVFARMSNEVKVALSSGPYDNLNAAMADARLKATGDLFETLRIDPDSVRTEKQFRAVVDAIRTRVADDMQNVVSIAGRTLVKYHSVRHALHAFGSTPEAEDVRAQLDNLIYPGFIAATPQPYFTYLDRYVQACQVRVDAWRTRTENDQMAIIHELEDAYEEAVARYPVGELPAPAVEASWLLEEMRVSLFAQALRTAQPVSAKRVRRVIAGLSPTQ